jgi:ribosomal protein S18 acetylase RimI-like enzyme
LERQTELERILAFRRAISERSSTRLLPFPAGVALFNDDYPRSWAHNFLRVDRPDAAAADLIAAAERLHAEAGHGHRSIEVADAAAGERLIPAFHAAGWNVERNVLMVSHRGFDRAVDTSAVEMLGWAEVRSAHEAFWRTSPYGDSEETVRQLVDRLELTAAAADVTHFAVRVGEDVVTTCDLYIDGRTAQVEDVWTEEGYRGRGFARAAVARTVEVARAAGCDLVWLEADADDWPRELYRKLGFDEIARTFSFVRPSSG